MSIADRARTDAVAAPAAHGSTAPMLTAVVCSLNGERTLGACLAALDAQTVRSAIEVIVVDDGSTDATPAIALRHGAVLATHEVNRGLSAARNTGIALAAAPLIAFTDDDCVPAPDWAERIIGAFESHPDVVGVGGEVEAAHADSYIRRYLAANNPLRPLEIDYARRDLWHRVRLYLGAGRHRATGLREVYSIVGASMAFRRDALRDVGGFDPAIRFGGDDEQICTALRDAHGPGALLVDPSVRVDHDFDPRWQDTLRRARAYGIGNGRDWARGGGLPSLPPTPIVTAGVAAILWLVRPALARVAVVALPALVFRRWFVHAVRHREPAALTWPVVQFAQEVATDVGFVHGWWRHR